MELQHAEVESPAERYEWDDGSEYLEVANDKTISVSKLNGEGRSVVVVVDGVAVALPCVGLAGWLGWLLFSVSVSHGHGRQLTPPTRRLPSKSNVPTLQIALISMWNLAHPDHQLVFP